MENTITNKSMNVTINRLPSRTWNHLNMNETVVSDVVLPVRDDSTLRTPVEEAKVENVTIRETNEEERQIFDNIETALGKDMDRLGESLPVKTILCSGTEDGTAAFQVTADGTYGRYFIYLDKNSHMNVSVYCTSGANATKPLYLQFKIYAQENASLNLSVVQTANTDSSVFTDIGGTLDKNATVNLVKMELGGKEVYSGAYMDLKGERSSFEAHIGYLGVGRQHLDMNYVARHHGKNTNSLMESDGVLRDEAFKLFRGTIDFIKGCPGSVGNEKEDVLLLGDDVVNQTIPLILCAEEDVEGNHGASIGELDEKTLFYLMSRGFSAEAVQKMIAKARLEAVATRIREGSVREKTLHFLEECQ